MAREITGAGKLFVTELALVVLDAQMGLHVRVEVRATGECGPTLSAGEWSLTGVCAQVLNQA